MTDASGALVHPCRRPRGRRVHRSVEDGATAVEYGLLVSGIAAVIAVAVYLFGGTVLGMFQDTCDTFASQQTSSGTC